MSEDCGVKLRASGIPLAETHSPMPEETAIDKVLSRWAGEPVLMDVGASGASPELWAPLAGRSWYVAFDPDRREMSHADGEGPFKRKTVVNEAIAAEPGTSEVRFYLTRSP